MNSKFTKLIPAAALVCLVLASCKKNEAVTSTSSPDEQLMRTTNLIDIGGDETNAEAADILDENESETTESSDCRVITYSPSKNVYPHTKTVDFGTGCTINGKTRSGKKFFTFYANPNTAPAGTRISVMTLSNFYVNGLNISGSAVIYLASTATPGPFALRIVTSKTFSDDQGNTSTFVGTRYIATIAGEDTKGADDNVYQSTGFSYGTEVDGGSTMASWKATTDENNPIIKYRNCPNNSKGGIKIEIDQNGVKNNEYLDYGNGTCDDKGTLSINNGTPVEITLPLRFFATHL